MKTNANSRNAFIANLYALGNEKKQKLTKGYFGGLPTES